MAEKDIEKIKIASNPVKFVEIDYKGQKIMVRTSISLKDKIILFKNYVDSYFKDGNVTDNYIDAKYGLIFGITDLCTNIDIQSLDIDEYIDNLWAEIYSKISNYAEFMGDIYNITKTIADNNTVAKSMGSVFDKVAGEILNFMKNIDISPDGINKLVKELQEQSSAFNNKYVSPPDDTKK